MIRHHLDNCATLDWLAQERTSGNPRIGSSTTGAQPMYNLILNSVFPNWRPATSYIRSGRGTRELSPVRATNSAHTISPPGVGHSTCRGRLATTSRGGSSCDSFRVLIFPSAAVFAPSIDPLMLSVGPLTASAPTTTPTDSTNSSLRPPWHDFAPVAAAQSPPTLGFRRLPAGAVHDHYLNIVLPLLPPRSIRPPPQRFTSITWTSSGTRRLGPSSPSVQWRDPRHRLSR